MPFSMEHIDRNVRKIVPPGTTFALCLDGHDWHASRNGFEWLELCVIKGCEVIQSPANTSYFLQPCDASINMCFKSCSLSPPGDLLSIRSRLIELLFSSTLYSTTVVRVHVYHTAHVNTCTSRVRSAHTHGYYVYCQPRRLTVLQCRPTYTIVCHYCTSVL